MWHLISKWFHCIFHVFLIINYTHAFSRASHGQNCSREIRCESRSFLSCTGNGTCDCLMSGSMVYDKPTGKCLTLAGERCQFTTAEAEKTWTDEVLCIGNANCRNGTCECDPTHYEVPNGTCQQKREHGMNCLSDEMCNDNNNLVCGADQTCTCRAGRVLSASSIRSTCVILAGYICQRGDQCTDAAICSNEDPTRSPKCVCLKTYYQTESGTCERKKGLHQSCGDDSHCIDNVYITSPTFVKLPSFLVCLDGKCQCDKSLAVEDSADVDRYCGKHLGHQCKPHECLTGAECSGTCQCRSNSHFETENKTCEPKRHDGEPCLSNEQCDSIFKCNSVTNTCTCNPGSAFSPVTSKCDVSPGHRCRESRYHSQVETCVPNAQCQQESYDGTFKCRCNDNYKTSLYSDSYCYVNKNGSCNGDKHHGTLTTKPCLPGLVCRNGTCKCRYKDHQVFEDDREKCLSFVGGPCDNAQDCWDKQAECITENEVSQCRCKTGYTQVERGCDIAYGNKCDQENLNPSCDRLGPLECSFREICECSDFQVYDNSTLKCRGLVGAKCYVGRKRENDASVACSEGAFCQPFRGFENIFGLCACLPEWKQGKGRICEIRDKEPTTTSTAAWNDLDIGEFRRWE